MVDILAIYAESTVARGLTENHQSSLFVIAREINPCRATVLRATDESGRGLHREGVISFVLCADRGKREEKEKGRKRERKLSHASTEPSPSSSSSPPPPPPPPPSPPSTRALLHRALNINRSVAAPSAARGASVASLVASTVAADDVRAGFPSSHSRRHERSAVRKGRPPPFPPSGSNPSRKLGR